MNFNLDGKKKFTATLSSLLLGLVGIAITSGMITEEAAAPIIQVLSILVPIGGAVVYDIVQGKQDVEKEKTKQAEEVIKARGGLPKAEPVISTVPVVETVTETVPVAVPPFDMAEFISRFDPKGELGDTERFYEYRHEGMKTKCNYIEHALAYIDKYIELAQKAIHGITGYPVEEAHEHLGDNRGNCPFLTVESMARQQNWKTLLMSYRQAFDMLTATEQLQNDIEDGHLLDWKYRLGPGATLHGVANRADELREAYWKNV